MRRNVATLFLQYARLERKRSVEGLSPLEEEIWANLRRYLSKRLNPEAPKGDDRRASLRVATEISCTWAPVARAHDGSVVNLSRSGVFLRTEAPPPVGEEISIRFALPEGGVLEVAGIVANHAQGSDPARRGMGVRFGPMAPHAMKIIDDLYQRSIVRQFGKPDDEEAPITDPFTGDLE